VRALQYGWWLVAVTVVILAVTAGVTTYSFSLFAIEIEREFGVDRSSVMWAATGHAIVSSFVAPYAGTLLDRYPTRHVVAIAAACMWVGLWMCARADTIWQLVIAYSLLVPIGTTTLTALLPPVLLTRWFDEQRGLALGIASTGTKLGGLIVPPVIVFGLAQLPWRMVLEFAASAALLITAVLAVLFLRDAPRRESLAAPRPRASGAPGGWGVLLKDRSFWLLAVYMSVMLTTFSVLLSNFAMLVNGIGASRADAALLLSTFSFVGLCASPLVGRLCDRARLQRVGSMLALVNAAALVVFVSSGTLMGYGVATVLAALGGGGIATFFGNFAAHLFDPQVRGRALGAVLSCAGLAAAFAPVAAGWMYDWTGGYALVLSVLAALLFAAALVSPFMRARSVPT
jgi:nitrate/nitrite transporter NarK